MDRSHGISSRFALAVCLLGLVAASCTAATGAPTTSGAMGSESWGSEAVAFFDRLAEVYRTNDVYGVLDFYTPEARIDTWRGDNRGGFPVQDLIKWNSGDLGVVIDSVNLGDAAVNLVRWPSIGDLGAVVSTVESGRVSSEVAYSLSDSLERSLRASPDVLATYDELYSAYAVAWASQDAVAIEALYADGAAIRDTVRGVTVPTAVEGVIDSEGSTAWGRLAPSDVFTDDAPTEGFAVFLGPAEYGVDPQDAIGVFDTEVDGCRHRVAVRWTLDATGHILDEDRFHDVASYAACQSVAKPTGWWTALPLPGPADQVETGSVTTPSGAVISVRNGTDDLESLLDWGLGRFAGAGLTEPAIDTVTFQPSRSCIGRSGRVVDDGVVRNLFVCMYDSDLCTRFVPCDVPATRSRLAFLHELAHAWLIDNVGPDTEARLVEVSGRARWDGNDIPWIQRGVEYAADTIAWGLMDTDLTMVRQGSPPCQVLADAYRLLTDVPPIFREGSCIIP